MLTTPEVDVRSLLIDTIGEAELIRNLEPHAPLLGGIAALDSVAIVNLVLAIEEQIGREIHDDELDASSFESIDTLASFVDQLRRRSV